MTRTVLVTAGARGIGRAVAEAFVAAGDRVWVADVSADALSALPPGLQGLVCDVADEAQVVALFDAVEARGAPVEVLVNNAGVPGARALLEQVALDDWTRTFAVNATGAFLCMRRAAPAMKAAGRGAILNVSTSSVATGLPERLPYVASKAALEALTLTAARELGPFNVRVNAIRPGAVKTPRMLAIRDELAASRDLTPEAMEAQMLSKIALRTWVDGEDIAAMAVFLASPAAARVTGQIVAVDGHVEWEG